jgi:hypothetical protein
MYICLDDLRRIGRFNRHRSAAWVPHGYAHRRATVKKQRHEMAADEASSAEHRHAVGHRLPLLALYRHRTGCAMLAIHTPGQYTSPDT